MTHNEQRAHWIKEGMIGFGVGAVYGITYTCVGHPFDTLKTKMQAQVGFEKTKMLQTFAKTFKTQGIRGLYRGCIPPLWGSGIYRSAQFAVFEAMYTFFDNPVMRQEVPGSGGVQLRVIAAGAIAGASRAVIETPLEYAKIRGQTNRKWQFAKVYTGFGITLVSRTCLMSTFFILLDSGRRHFPDNFDRPLLGPFLTSGLSAIGAWWLIWPLEYMKSQVQSDYGKNVSVITRMRTIMAQQGGFLALYRGILPGTLRAFLSNGFSMIIMMHLQRKISELGLRG